VGERCTLTPKRVEISMAKGMKAGGTGCLLLGIGVLRTANGQNIQKSHIVAATLSNHDIRERLMKHGTEANTTRVREDAIGHGRSVQSSINRYLCPFHQCIQSLIIQQSWKAKPVFNDTR
jgi:hypothetical protein